MRIYLDNLKFCKKLNLIEYFIKKKTYKNYLISIIEKLLYYCKLICNIFLINILS